MNFFIQANTPQKTGVFESDDYDLSTAIETIFPMLTEDAILVWNHIYVPLSYKYDISCMMEDIIKMLNSIRLLFSGELEIRWPSNTFESKGHIKWADGVITVTSFWQTVVGDTVDLLNSKNKFTMETEKFMNEWKRLMGNVLEALLFSGYNPNELSGMDKLIDEYEVIKKSGVLYEIGI
ncbi:hypothetical protein F0040_14890 [Listeria monocytogenes]|uniref:Uncharacterized protein n=1 Tax=Listeria monocytogenes serotype 1/2a TaxID=1906951 RepID=A0A9P1YLN2_LISMN|nr:hypothetical protein [Listeria monocytogenes]EAF3074222.1 hypothetical protein [Listeria monocytogenes serotype 1/2a]EAC8515263.1 hypothetical protein [Listeria monocytogenes]ECQ8346244.1 hypothetical protein [Listeria monocytogenes]EGF6981716.1 hypothetical protein [Listeria monocytogenes]OFH52847.1 hypothetical protein BJN07_07975 [Listeria monocytogenes]